MVAKTEKKMDWPDCDICHKPVTTKAGRLSMSKTYTDIGLTGQWRWGHTRCLPANDYYIYADEFDTEKAAVNWLVLLRCANWFVGTNWRETWQRFYDVDIDYDSLPIW